MWIGFFGALRSEGILAAKHPKKRFLSQVIAAFKILFTNRAFFLESLSAFLASRESPVRQRLQTIILEKDMTRTNILTLAISAFATLGLSCTTASAQRFIDVEYGPEQNLPTHGQVQHALGPAASHRGNQGLPLRDQLQSTGGYGSSAGSAIQRQNTIWTRGGMSNNWGNYTPQARNYQAQYGQFDPAQFQRSVQQLQQAVQQFRQNRQQYPNYYGQNYRQHQYNQPRLFQNNGGNYGRRSDPNRKYRFQYRR